MPTAGGEQFDFDGFTIEAILAHHSVLPTEVLQKLGGTLGADSPQPSPEEQQWFVHTGSPRGPQLHRPHLATASVVGCELQITS